MSNILKTTVWGVKVPVAYFDACDADPLNHPDRVKEDWILVVSRSAHVQKAIERECAFRRTKPYAMYVRLIDDPSLVFDVTYRINRMENTSIGEIISFRARRPHA